MSGKADHDVSRSTGNATALAPVRHKHFIRDLDFKMQQRKKVSEVLSLLKQLVQDCP